MLLVFCLDCMTPVCCVSKTLVSTPCHHLLVRVACEVSLCGNDYSQITIHQSLKGRAPGSLVWEPRVLLKPIKEFKSYTLNQSYSHIHTIVAAEKEIQADNYSAVAVTITVH